MKDRKMLFGIGIVLLFLASVGLSYAYFTATIVNKDVKDQVVETGTLKLTYTDGPEIVMNNIKPGDTVTKTISVGNTGTLTASYNLVWQELTNEITGEEMLIEAKCFNLSMENLDEEGTACEGVESTPIEKMHIKDNISIEPGIVHRYIITITFKETNENQNYNQGKKFSSVLGVTEYKTPTVINCTFDGELTQGVEYVNGQYTYHYMQEMDLESASWTNLDIDGWGVITNADTGDITSKLCTYINEKPVVSMNSMFASRPSITSVDFSSFNTSNVINMSTMFYGSPIESLNLSSFDTSKVKNMSYMFHGSAATTIIGLNIFDTSNVTNMRGMFGESKMTTLDLSSFDTSNVTNMSYLFYDSPYLKTIYASNKFVTTKVIDDDYIFYNNVSLIGGAGTAYDDTKMSKTYARIDDGSNSNGLFTLKNS